MKDAIRLGIRVPNLVSDKIQCKGTQNKGAGRPRPKGFESRTAPQKEKKHKIPARKLTRAQRLMMGLPSRRQNN